MAFALLAQPRAPLPFPIDCLQSILEALYQSIELAVVLRLPPDVASIWLGLMDSPCPGPSATKGTPEMKLGGAAAPRCSGTPPRGRGVAGLGALVGLSSQSKHTSMRYGKADVLTHMRLQVAQAEGR
jgi:hypothetical protein